MKKTLLISLISFVGMFSVAFAASSIPGRIDGDLYFDDQVYTSGVTYPSDIDGDTGTSSIQLGGEGSLAIGRRAGGGFPRVVLYGGTNFSVEQDFTSRSKNWWTGNIKSPNKVLNIPLSKITWNNDTNHILGERNIASSFGFESVSETYTFSPQVYIVLPVEVPNNAKVWYAFHSVDPENPDSSSEEVTIMENNFCVVENNLCVIGVENMNQVILVEESFETCPRREIENGSAGVIPYCIISCKKGYELDDNAVSCIASEGTEIEILEINNQEESAVEATPKEEVIFRSARLHYTGAGPALEPLNTSGLTGEELQTALRRNAEKNNRRNSAPEVEKNNSVSSLRKIVNDIRGKLWSWETQRGMDEDFFEGSKDNNQELEMNGETAEENGGEAESLAAHSAGPLLPSTGSSTTIFIIISILGIGLMLLAFKR